MYEKAPTGIRGKAGRFVRRSITHERVSGCGSLIADNVLRLPTTPHSGSTSREVPTLFVFIIHEKTGKVNPQFQKSSAGPRFVGFPSRGQVKFNQYLKNEEDGQCNARN